MRSALGAASGTIGVTVLDRRTGVRFSSGGSRQIEMASTAKVLILLSLLRVRRAEGGSLGAGERALVRAMIRESDNDAADALRSAAGGAAALAKTARLCSMPVTAASTLSRYAWGMVLTTSDEQATLMALVAAGGLGVLDAADCAYTLSEMRHVDPSEAWGAGIVGSRTVSAAVKNGWLPVSYDGAWRVNTIGYVRGDGRDFVIACYEKGLATEAQGIQHKNTVVRTVHAALAAHLRLG